MTRGAANRGAPVTPVRPVAAARLPPLIPVLVFVVAVAVWAWSTQAWLIQDDFVTVFEAPTRWPLAELREIFLPPAAEQVYLRPLPSLTYYMDDLLWGDSLIWGWHLTNVLLHAANAAVLAWLLLRIGRGVALVGGVIFAVQPVAAEPVTWISARPDLLMAGAAMLSLAAFAGGRRLLSAFLLLAALLCKEAAVSLPLIISAWVLYRRGRLIRETGWHWAAVTVYLIYRLIALHGIGGRADWATHPAAWLWDIFRAFALPLPVNMHGWAAPAVLPAGLWTVAALVMLAATTLVVLNLRRTWLPLTGLLLAVLPALPLLQLGPSLQFSRYLYFASAFWAVAVALALNSLFGGGGPHASMSLDGRRTRYRAAARRPAYLLAAAAVVTASLAAGAGPRVQFHQASRAAMQISESVRSATGQPASGAQVLVQGTPARVNGWLIFGDYIGTAAYGMEAAPGGPVRVIDQSWLQETGAPPADRESADVLMSFEGPPYSQDAAACAVRKSAVERFPGRALNPCLPQKDDGMVDLGAGDLFQRAPTGFRWNEGMGSTRWVWTVQPDAALHVRVSDSERKIVKLRVASLIENRVELLLNGKSLGARSVPAGFGWVDVIFFASSGVWRSDGRQQLMVRGESEEGGLFLAVDRLEILPWVPVVRVDFEGAPLEEYEPRGFAGGDSVGGDDWTWLTDRAASISLPFGASGDSHLVFRVASDTGAVLKITAGGREVGEFQVPRGHRWVEGGVFVPKSLWSEGPAQTFLLDASVGGPGGRVALDWIEDRPVTSQSEFDFGEEDATRYAGRGFGLSGHAPDATYQFIDSNTAVLGLPFRTDGPARLGFRMASMLPARVAVVVNGETTGMFDLDGGGVFVDAAVLVPAGRWVAGPVQRLELNVTHEGQAAPLLLDRVFLGPSIGSAHVDLGAAHPASVGGAGFGPVQHAGGVDWNWAGPGAASLHLRLPAGSSPYSEVWFRVMSDSPVVARVTVNAQKAGRLDVPGGFRWVWRRVSLPPGAARLEEGIELGLSPPDGGSSKIAFDQIEVRNLRGDSVIDFGLADLGEYAAVGFSTLQSDGAGRWVWMTSPRATLSAPIARGSPRLLTVRWMSAVPNRAGVTVNGVRVGEVSLPGGYVWRTCSFLVPRAAITQGDYQEVEITGSRGSDGHFVAISYMETQKFSGRYQIGLASPDAGCADLAGWRWAEGDTQHTWRWATADAAVVRLSSDLSQVTEVRMTAMSEVDNVLQLSLDDVELGEVRLPGGFQWTELRFPLAMQPSDGFGPRRLKIKSSSSMDGLFFAAETIELVMK